MKPAVAVLSDIADPPAVLQRARAEFALLGPAEAAATENLARVEAVITNSHVGAPAWVWRAPRLRIVSCNGVGYDGIDVARAQAAGIWVSNTPEVLNEEVANLALALILASARQLLAADRYARAGRWARQDYPLVAGIANARLGLLGMGGIGRAIAARAEAFQMQVSYCCRNQKEVSYPYQPDLLALARWSSILCAVVPGGAATRNLIDAKVLAALGPGGYLVNVARGSVVDEKALVEALAGGRIAGAGLDVYASEPDIPAELVALDNVILLPHVGSGSVAAREAMGLLALDNIKEALAGRRPRGAVNEVS